MTRSVMLYLLLLLLAVFGTCTTSTPTSIGGGKCVTASTNDTRVALFVIENLLWLNCSCFHRTLQKFLIKRTKVGDNQCMKEYDQHHDSQCHRIPFLLITQECGVIFGILLKRCIMCPFSPNPTPHQYEFFLQNRGRGRRESSRLRIY